MRSPKCRPFYAAISAIERLAAASYQARIERQPSRRIDKNLARSGVGVGLGTELSAEFPVVSQFEFRFDPLPTPAVGMTAESRLKISDMMIRREQPSDIPAIRAVVTSAFRNAPHSSGNEAAIVDGLREGGALTISLIAEDEGELVGHVAFSPIKINAEAVDWYRLGPIAVRPDKQRHGVGRALIEAGLDGIRSLHARGCVVLGDPAYYGRFGFRSDLALRNTRVPAEYFQQLSFGDEKRRGIVKYHPAFFAS